MLLTNTFLWLSFASCSPSMYQQRCASVILLCASLGISKLPTLRSDVTEEEEGDWRPEGSGGEGPGGGGWGIMVVVVVVVVVKRHDTHP